MPASARWTLPNVLAILAMWAVMMAAMMLPSALPMALTFVNMGRADDLRVDPVGKPSGDWQRDRQMRFRRENW